MNNKWKSITKNDVLKAIELFLNSDVKYPEPRSTFLIFGGKKLPAKHIRGMAYKIANNFEISKEDYSGGEETVRFFNNLGFEVEHKGIIKSKYIRPEANTKIEVDKKIDNNTKLEEVVDIRSNNNHDISPNEFKINTQNKIKISSKDVTGQKNQLQLLLNKIFNGDIVCEKTFDWLKTPNVLTDEYIEIVNNLTNYRNDTNFIKKNRTLRCDFVCENEKIIIEYDERQHFTEARKLTLEAYNKTLVYYDKNLWLKACADVQAKDGQPYNRDEIRAYYDSTRDIESYKNGYTLIRIMHGQIDFNKKDAMDKLVKLINDNLHFDIYQLSKIKLAMYLQTNNVKNKKDFDKAMKVVSNTDIDILVFPEFSWVPFIQLMEESDLTIEEDYNKVVNECLKLSKKINKAIIIGSYDKNDLIYDIYANANATEDETKDSIYIKHIGTPTSAFDFKNYCNLSKVLYSPIIYKDHYIGMTICYDCNHAIFSRMHSLQGADIIVNNSGGDIDYNKWYKYNQSRAIENSRYTFVTMGGEANNSKIKSYVYGFNPNGKKLSPKLINYESDTENMPGGIYIYDLADDDASEEPEPSINQVKTENKYKDIFIPEGNVDSYIQNSLKLDENLYIYKYKNYNIVFILTYNDEILLAENFLPLMYSDKLKEYDNLRYILVCKYNDLDIGFYKNKLSVVLKVKAMENFCAVLLESNVVNNCYQTGKSRSSQVVKATDGKYGLDLSRMTGPESIWKNKSGRFRAAWRDKYEWLISNCKHIADTGEWK